MRSRDIILGQLANAIVVKKHLLELGHSSVDDNAEGRALKVAEDLLEEMHAELSITDVVEDVKE